MAGRLTLRETIRAATGPLLLIAVGILFLVDYSGGYAVRQTWPVLLILFGAGLALQSLAASPAQPQAKPRRRKSLAGPVLLIAIGAVALAHNLNPDIPLRALFAGYWPWVLILWGGFRLLELLMTPLLGWAVPYNPGPGTVFLVLLLVLTGTAARSDLPDFEGVHIEIEGTLNEAFGQTYKFPLEQSAELDAGATVVLRNLRGRIRVVGSETTGLNLKGDVQVRAESRQNAEGLNVPLEISRGEDRTVVQPRALPREKSRHLSYDLEVRLPENTAVTTESPRAEIFVENFSRPVTLEAGRGKIHLKSIGGPVRVNSDRAKSVEARDLADGFELNGNTSTIELRSVDGPVRIRGDLFGTVKIAELRSDAEFESRYGKLRTGKVPGELEIRVRRLSGGGVAERLEIRSSRWRRVRLIDVNGEVDIEGRRMDLELGLGSAFGRVHAEVNRGDIELRLPASSQFSLDAETDRGRVRHSFGDALDSQRRGSDATLKGSIGEGPHLRLKTGRGDISVRTHQGEESGGESQVLFEETVVAETG